MKLYEFSPVFYKCKNLLMMFINKNKKRTEEY